MEDKIGHKFEFEVDKNAFIGFTITHCVVGTYVKERRFEEKKQNN